MLGAPKNAFVVVVVVVVVVDCNVSSKNLLSLFLQKTRQPVFFFCKLITVNSNSLVNLPREAAVKIVLDISKNSYDNVYNEVLPTWSLLILPD